MGGEFTYQPKWDPIGFDHHSHRARGQGLVLCEVHADRDLTLLLSTNVFIPRSRDHRHKSKPGIKTVGIPEPRFKNKEGRNDLWLGLLFTNLRLPGF